MTNALCEPCGGKTPHVGDTCLICLPHEERVNFLKREIHALSQIEMAVTDGEGAESEAEMVSIGVRFSHEIVT